VNGATVTFYGTVVSTGTTISSAWDFGDGSGSNITGDAVMNQHTYTANGIYTVQVAANLSNGRNSSSTNTATTVVTITGITTSTPAQVVNGANGSKSSPYPVSGGWYGDAYYYHPGYGEAISAAIYYTSYTDFVNAQKQYGSTLVSQASVDHTGTVTTNTGTTTSSGGSTGSGSTGVSGSTSPTLPAITSSNVGSMSNAQISAAGYIYSSVPPSKQSAAVAARYIGTDSQGMYVYSS
jgi:PKD repeat protein